MPGRNILEIMNCGRQFPLVFLALSLRTKGCQTKSLAGESLLSELADTSQRAAEAPGTTEGRMGENGALPKGMPRQDGRGAATAVQMHPK